MKKLFFFVFILYSFWSCSLGDDTDSFNYEFVPIENVTIADTLVLDAVHTVVYSYYRPTSCHGFHDLYYSAEDNERTVAVINAVYDNSDCEPLEENSDNLIERTFNFKPLNTGTYVFKFWQGLDENDEDQYLVFEIPVED
ncbi:MAG: hypothetical protein HKO81_04345 [Flavobacteriaceae bacterium]|nr:hypothetical protein [Bacteroidia bacterium]NNL15855.1 hypothetical protein [Flavobacteriaceae bacterium]